MRRLAAAVMALAVTATFALAPQSAEARRLWPVYGASGDGQSPIECPDGEAMVGFDGRTGTNIDQLQIMCAPLLADRTFGTPRPWGDPIGGAGGSAMDAVTCPRDARMHELVVVLNNAGKQIQGLEFNCMDTAGNVTGRAFQARSANFGESYRTTNRRHSCPQEYFVGVSVAFGQHVNGVGSICDAVTSTQPKPIRNTGRARPTPAPAAATPALAPRSAFGGKWRLRTNQSADFDLYLVPAGDGRIIVNGRLEDVPLQITGQFINLQDAKDYDGSLQGVVQPNSRVLTYSYGQKNGVTGGGTFTLSNDGNSITGEGATSDGTKFTWGGNRLP